MAKRESGPEMRCTVWTIRSSIDLNDIKILYQILIKIGRKTVDMYDILHTCPQQFSGANLRIL